MSSGKVNTSTPKGRLAAAVLRDLLDVTDDAVSADDDADVDAVLAHVAGHSLLDSWIVASFALYIFVGLFWLPVLWLQKRMRDLAVTALQTGAKLPPVYDRYFRIWFVFGWPAFAAMIAIFWLMITRPQLW